MKILFKRSNLFLLLVLFLSACGCTRSWAEIFRYQDPQTEFTLNYPDSWGRIHNQKPDDVFTVAAPDNEDFAICRIRVREDGRFKIYPEYLGDSIQNIHFSKPFWDEYMNEYNNGEVIKGVDDGGFGRGFASLVEASYNSIVGYQGQKTALMAVAHYYDKTYIYECSAATEMYGKYYQGFTNILRSVDFKKILHGHPSGEYRDFISEGSLYVHGEKTQDLYQQ